jgi:DNA-binding NarL/FixJ family response regulator
MSPAPDGARISVLLVEDSDLIRERLLSLLHAIPGVHVVGQADTAADAIGQILSLRPHAVLLDIRLKAGSGIEVLNAVKRHVPETVVIMLTNYATPETRKRCQQAGVDHFLDKSNEFQNIRPILEQLQFDHSQEGSPCKR